MAPRERHPHRRAPRFGTADEVRWFEIDPGHVQHFWNGWVDGDRIEFSGTRFEHPDFGIDPSAALDESTVDNTPPYPARFWVDLAADTAGWEQTDDLGGDFARFNDDFDGVRSRYHYMSAAVAPSVASATSTASCATTTPRGSARSGTPARPVTSGRACSPRIPQGQAEDDGWLINAVYDAATDRTDVCVLDARDVAAGPDRPGAPDPAHAVRIPRQLVRRRLSSVRGARLAPMLSPMAYTNRSSTFAG